MEKRVFVVDDVLGTHSLLAQLFQWLGGFVVVASATSEGEAKLWLEEHPGGWDVAVVDLVLEAGSGMGVIARCKELDSTAAVVVFSGYTTPTLAQHCTRLGADAVFRKERPEEFVTWLKGQAEARAAATPA